MTGGWKLSSLMRQSVDINDSMAQEDPDDDDSTGKKAGKYNIILTFQEPYDTPIIFII